MAHGWNEFKIIFTNEIMLHDKLSHKIIGCFYNVYNELGFGFLEKVYENALFTQLMLSGLYCVKQQPIKVSFKNVTVGNYFADILVEDKIIIEVKSASSLCEEHELQLINYLRATNFEVGLLLNFGQKAQFRRKLFENKFKKNLCLSVPSV